MVLQDNTHDVVNALLPLFGNGDDDKWNAISDWLNAGGSLQDVIDAATPGAFVLSSDIDVVTQVDTEVSGPGGSIANGCIVIANQIKTGSASDGRPHDLVLLATTNPDYLEPPLYYTDYDIVFDREDAEGRTNTGVVIFRLPVRFAEGIALTDDHNTPLITFSTGILDVAGTLRGEQGANDNLILRLGGQAASRVAIQTNNGLTDILKVTENGGNVVAITGTMTFPSGGTAAVSGSSNRLDLRGGSSGLRLLNSGFTSSNLSVSDAGVFTWRNATTHRDGSGSPEGVVAAPVGSTYSRTDGGAGTSFYVKESGTGNTGWVGK